MVPLIRRLCTYVQWKLCLNLPMPDLVLESPRYNQTSGVAEFSHTVPITDITGTCHRKRGAMKASHKARCARPFDTSVASACTRTDIRYLSSSRIPDDPVLEGLIRSW